MGKGKPKKEEKGKDEKSKGETPKGEKPSKPAEVQKKPRIQEIIRLVETNLDGGKKVRVAIRDIKGISFMLSNAIAKKIDFAEKRLGELSEMEMKKLEEIIFNPDKFGIPAWLYNRRKDPATGEDKHIGVSKLDLTKKMDIDAMKKMNSYKGVRHIYKLPVRGQRTRSGSGGKTVGVSKKKQQPAKKKK